MNQGMQQLFKTPVFVRQTILLLTIGVVIVITSEMLDSFLTVEYNFTEIMQGFFWSIVFLASAGASHISDRVIKKFGEKSVLFFLGIVISLTLLISPVIGLIVGGITILIRALSQTIINNAASAIINREVESKYRATSLSAFNMLKNVPYIFLAILFGISSDLFSAKQTAVFIGILLLFLLFLQVPKKTTA